MSVSLNPKSYCDVRKQFTASLDSLIATAKSSYEAAINKGQNTNYRPPKLGDWDGSLYDLEGISKAFSREEHKNDVIKAIGDVRRSGTIGDLVASVKQGDYLAVQERAFRLMNTGRVRSSIHVAARQYGHQHPAGLFAKGVMGEVSDIVRKAKDFAPA